MYYRLFYTHKRNITDTYKELFFQNIRKGNLKIAYQFGKLIISDYREMYFFSPYFQWEINKKSILHKTFYAIYDRLAKTQEHQYTRTIGKSDILEGRLYENKRTFKFSDEGGFANGIRCAGIEICIGGTGFEKDPLFLTIQKVR